MLAWLWTSSGRERVRERGTEGAAVFAYHGVQSRATDPLLDDYAMDAVSFRAHVRFFRRRREVVPLREIVERVRTGRAVPARWAAFTLDDALLNQVTTAAEIFGEERLPWALAVPAGLVETGRSIWASELRFLIMECWPFPTVPSPTPSGEEWPTTSVTGKRATLQRLLARLFHEVDDVRRSAYLEQLIDRAGRPNFLAALAADGRFNMATWANVGRLRGDGVEILSHGWNHRPQNATITRDSLEEEIVRSRRVIGERLGSPPDGFALPHSARCPGSDALLESAGYSFCLSSQPRRVTAATSLWNVPRFSAEYPLAVLRRQILSGA